MKVIPMEVKGDFDINPCHAVSILGNINIYHQISNIGRT